MIENGAASPIIVAGFIIGTVLYSALLWTFSSQPDYDRFAVFTGVFGLTWNLGSLSAYGLADLQITDPIPLLMAVSFGALCFLPAAVIHAAARNGETGPWPWSDMIVSAGYSIGGIATAMHLYCAVVWGYAPSQIALRATTPAFVVLLLGLLVVTRGRTGWARSLCVAALAVSAVSALHLGGNHSVAEPWWLAVIGHHASLPLPLAILYRDYRTALAGRFVKRWRLNA